MMNGEQASRRAVMVQELTDTFGAEVTAEALRLARIALDEVSMQGRSSMQEPVLAGIDADGLIECLKALKFKAEIAEVDTLEIRNQLGQTPKTYIVVSW
jgi:hypothetical protein